jgi:hypothetical protein
MPQIYGVGFGKAACQAYASSKDIRVAFIDLWHFIYYKTPFR